MALSVVVACGSDANRPRPNGGAGQAAAGAGGDPSRSGSGQGGSSGVAGEGGESGEGGAAGEGGYGGECTTFPPELPPWSEYSQHLELYCFGYFQGPMLFSADRDQLSAAELAILDGFRRTEPIPDGCSSDPLNCEVAITSDAGEVIEYQANEGDAVCFNEAKPALARARVDALIAAVGCKFAQDFELATAEPLSPSAGCFHGLHPSNAPIHQRLSLPEANRRYHVEVAGCVPGTLGLELFGSDPSQPLAVGVPVAEPGPRRTCSAFELEVQAPLTADLVITPKAGFESDDFYLNFR
ncbi:MAG TPA: hypothetical protein VFK05_01250 [Polyangiaceae bacterium]|nr:hypothetical protein [Polyangiaceae bacterium]